MQINSTEQELYHPDPQLLAAINTALYLKRPLLLAGEPGTGKTECADFIARSLKVMYPDVFKMDNALRFNVKSTSQSSDLFYQYDAVSHFGDKTSLPKEHFISFSSLGLALLRTAQPVDKLAGYRNYHSGVIAAGGPCGSVVLIDEIDKASRDFSNDLLAELEKPPFKFSIKEMMDSTFVQDSANPVIIVVTSNNEKSLPDAFLRRCIFHYIDFPTPEQLIKIVAGKPIYNDLGGTEKRYLDVAIKKFIELRRLSVSKQPATSELIDWIICLNHNHLLNQQLEKWSEADPANRLKIKETLAVLAKSKADNEQYSKGL